jgi:alpha-glucosidase (family GH31 glycosyl hydrolase)
VLGPWFQPGGSLEEQRAQIEKLRAADAPLSVAQTFFHYLPCGGDRSGEPERTAAFHALGLAVTTYFNPMLCESYAMPFQHAVRTTALERTAAGAPYLYQYFTTQPFTVGQYDFASTSGQRAFQQLLEQAIDDGHDGWMEDFGEYTPLDAYDAQQDTGSALHNRYVVDYHCAAYEFARRQARPVARFQRSGWTGAARCAQIVWSGDPTVDWGFDGLASVVRTGLGMGLSGVSTWGSDIGGFFSLSGQRLTGELLQRWVELGSVSGVMRTERDGIAIPSYTRPQVEDDDQIGTWRRYAKLRTQLYPYIAAAAEEYRRTGMPIMRHLILAWPEDSRSQDVDDEFLFGPDLLVAPVLAPGATTCDAYLPTGEWIDFWRAVRFEPSDGSLVLERADVITGGRDVSVPAPIEELPLFARAGTLLALVPPDVQTLADYGDADGGIVRLADRGGRRNLLAFPRARSSARFEHAGQLESREVGDGWVLEVHGAAAEWSLQASLATLEAPFTPCAVEWRGKTLGREFWTYDPERQVLRARFSGPSGRLVVAARCS